jgi:hypothetical protein
LQQIKSIKTMPYLVEFQWRSRSPSHSLVDDRKQVANFAVPWNIRFAHTVKVLLSSVEMLQEYHDRSWWRFQFASFGYYIEVQAKITLPSCHVIPDHLHV